MNITSFNRAQNEINNDPFKEVIKIIEHFLEFPSIAIKQGKDLRERSIFADKVLYNTIEV